jgi:hypothetical protein
MGVLIKSAIGRERCKTSPTNTNVRGHTLDTADIIL